jgi:hypothetical protein
MGVEMNISGLIDLGISESDIGLLRGISRCLSEWYDLCSEWGSGGGYVRQKIIRDEFTGVPLLQVYFSGHLVSSREYRDYERGALNRLGKIMSCYEDLSYYLDKEAGGSVLYIYRSDLLGDHDIGKAYSSVGIGVY